jgi:hypothetical protein
MSKTTFKQPDVPDFIQKIFLNQKNFLGTQQNEEAMLTKSVFRNIVSKLNFDLPTPQPVQESVFIQEESKKPDFLIIEKKSTRFQPQHNDSLYWCMFVHANDEALYQTKIHLKTNMTNLLMSEKKQMSDFFNKNDNKILKNTNQKITLTTAVELKSDLMTKPYMMNYSALISCCLYFKCPIYAINEKTKTYILFQPNDYVSDNENIAEDPNAVVLYSEKGRISLETDADEKKKMITTLIEGNKYLKLEQYDKPLLAISNYKIEDLQNIYSILFDECPKMKKPEYYDKIVERCSVHILEKLI